MRRNLVRSKFGAILVCILTTLFVAFFVVACSHGTEDVALTHNSQLENKIPGKKITGVELNRMLKRNQSFTLFAYEKSCPPCKREIKQLKSFKTIKNFFTLELADEKLDKLSHTKKLNIQYTPTILKVSRGKVIVRAESYLGKQELKLLDLSNPDRSVNQYNSIDDVFVPVSSDEFAEATQRKQSFIAYIGRPTCSDCQSFEKKFLTEDLSQFAGRIKYLNVENLRKNVPKWTDFKTQYRIAGTPSFVAIKDGELLSSSTWTVQEGYSSTQAVTWLKENLPRVN